MHFLPLSSVFPPLKVEKSSEQTRQEDSTRKCRSQGMGTLQLVKLENCMKKVINNWKIIAETANFTKSIARLSSLSNAAPGNIN